MVGRCQAAFALESPRPSDVASLQNCTQGNGAIARKETAFLTKPDDLMTIIRLDDAGVACLEALSEALLLALYRLVGHKVSTELEDEAVTLTDDSYS